MTWTIKTYDDRVIYSVDHVAQLMIAEHDGKWLIFHAWDGGWTSLMDSVAFSSLRNAEHVVEAILKDGEIY